MKKEAIESHYSGYMQIEKGSGKQDSYVMVVHSFSDKTVDTAKTYSDVDLCHSWYIYRPLS